MRLLSRTLPFSPILFTAAVTLGGCSDDAGSIKQIRGVANIRDALDFGDVQVGIVATLEIEVKNTGGSTIKFGSIEPGDAFTGPTYAFKVSPSSLMVAPAETKRITVTFQPLAEMAQPVQSSFRIMSDLPDPDSRGANRVFAVSVKGRGVKSGLLVEPNPVEFGGVLSGSSRTLDVKITNALSIPVDILSRLAPDGRAQINVTEGSGRFEIVSPIAANGSLVAGGGKLDPGVSLIVKAKYTPDPGAPEGRLDVGHWVIANCGEQVCAVTVDLRGHGTNSALDCMPRVVDFGAINPNRTADRQITCKNVAGDTVLVTRWGAGMSTAPEYVIAPYSGMPGMLRPDESFTIAVRFAPTLVTLQSGMRPTGSVVVQARNTAADRDLPVVTIPLQGEAGGPTIAVLPTALNFGDIAIGTRSTKTLLVQNNGYSDLIVTSIAPDAAGAAAYSTNTSAFRLATGTSTIVRVTFAPSVEGPVRSDLLIVSNDGSTPELRVPLNGVGVRLPPCNYSLMPPQVNFGVINVQTMAMQSVRVINTGTDDCLMNEVTLNAPTPTPYTLPNGPETGIRILPGGSKDIPIRFVPTRSGNHNATLTFYISSPTAPNPEIPIFGVGQATTEIMCPPPVTTPAGTGVRLALNVVSMGTMIQNYQWQITSAPMGGIGTPNQWNPSPPNQATETFLPFIVGVYNIHVTATDNVGGSSSCDIMVTAVGHGLRVQLTWNGMGDVDLHLHNANQTRWFSPPSDDCYYANRTPRWSAVAAENPALDFDNVTGFGPENIRIDQVVPGQTYTVGVHNFANAAGRVSTIQIFCGGVTSPTAMFVGRPHTGNAAGNCTGNDFWTVASVVFRNATDCTVTPVDAYSTSQQRCMAF